MIDYQKGFVKQIDWQHGKNRSMQHYFADDINGKYHFASPRYHGDMTFNDVGLRTDHRWPGSAYDSD